MPCVRPKDAYQHYLGGQLKFKLPKSEKKAAEFLKTHNPVQVRCGECADCLQREANDWSVRQYLEAMTSENNFGINLFITQTYDEENIPSFGFYQYQDMQLFQKRLRSRQAYYARKMGLPKEATKYRFLTVPEYGAHTYRPHYHTNFFDLWIPDLTYDGEKKDILELEGRGQKAHKFRSKMLEVIWGKGHIDIQAFGIGTAKYLARHNIKQTGGSTRKHIRQRYYRIREESRKKNKELTGIDLPVDWDTGEIMPEQIPVPRVFASSRPGIGRTAYENWKTDFFPSDFFVIDGKKIPVPKYFQKILKQEDIDLYYQVMEARQKNRKELTPEQLEAREKAILKRLEVFSTQAKI